MNPALKLLYDLQQVDSALASAQRRLRDLDPGRAEQAAADQACQKHEAARASYTTCSGNLHDAELDLKGVETKKADLESRLYGGKVQAFKEMESMQQEIQALGRRRSTLEDTILTLMDEIEVLRANATEAEAQRKTAEEALANRRAEYDRTVAVLNQKIASFTEERTKRAAPVPAAAMKRYETMRASKQGVAIGGIHDSCCGVCHTQLPVNTLRSIADTDAMETCENCGRLLYMEEG